MKTVLVTGASGFIGRRMTAAAQAAGWHVIGLGRAAEPGEDRRQRTEGGRRTTEDRGQSRNADAFRYGWPMESGGRRSKSRADTRSDPKGETTDWITADLAADTPLELPAGIDAIIHLAGKAHALAEVAQDEAEYFRINTDGTRRLLEAAQCAGVRAFVLFSTVKAVGEIVGSPLVGGPSGSEAVRTQGPTLQEAQPFDESCATPPDTPYGQSKRAAEKLVLEGSYVPHPVVLRPCLVYGPTPKGNLEKMIAAVKRGRFPPLPEVGNKRSMVHIDDVIAAALLAAEHPAAKGQVFIAADNEPFSTRQLFEWICLAAGKKVPRWTMPLWTFRLLGRVGDLIGKIRGRRFMFDSDALAKLTGNAWYTSAKLQRELGWKPRHTLRETLPEIVRGAHG